MPRDDYNETSIEISQRILEEKVASGEVEIVGHTEDERTLYRENLTEYKGV